MTNTQLLRERLEAEQKILLEELRGKGVLNTETNEWEAVPEKMETEPDANVLADKFEDFDEREAITETLSARLHDTESALKKIQDGVFGNCETCGKPIEEDRLDANPSARTCKEHMG
jgi:RNA polymerase-binding transcription factor DksA